MNGTAASDSTLLTTVGLAEQAVVRRQRRLGAHDAAPAFQALEQRRLLAADISARAHADLEVECPLGAGCVRAEQSGLARDGDGARERGDRMRILGAHVDEALGGAHREAGDRHALDQQEGVALHQHAVGEGAAVALVGVADDVFLVGWPHRAPSST